MNANSNKPTATTKAAKTFTIQFLDMTIQDTGNSDGITLVGKDGDSEECSIGNFNDLKTAKKWATLWFMIQRPARFGHSIWLRLGHLFRDYCRKNKITIPDDITASNDINAGILCCGEEV